MHLAFRVPVRREDRTLTGDFRDNPDSQGALAPVQVSDSICCHTRGVNPEPSMLRIPPITTVSRISRCDIAIRAISWQCHSLFPLAIDVPGPTNADGAPGAGQPCLGIAHSVSPLLFVDFMDRVKRRIASCFILYGLLHPCCLVCVCMRWRSI